MSKVKSFLGMIGVCRMFIKDFGKMAEPINKLTRKGVLFYWGPAQDKSMQELKDALAKSPALRPLDYESAAEVVLAVDTSWKAVGYYIYQVDKNNRKTRYYAHFGSCLLNEREGRFSQAKRELFGLYRALHECEYWLIGCRKLIVETDAKYLSGMLAHPSMGPNATVNRWIETILTKFHFTLRHVPGKTFAANGLSRQDAQPGDAIIEVLDPEDDHIEPVKFEDPTIAKVLYGISNEDWEEPLDFEDFKHEIDKKSGYLHNITRSVEDFQEELNQAEVEGQADIAAAVQAIRRNEVSTEDCHPVFQLAINPSETPVSEEVDRKELYHEERRTSGAKRQDNRLVKLKR